VRKNSSEFFLKVFAIRCSQVGALREVFAIRCSQVGALREVFAIRCSQVGLY